MARKDKPYRVWVHPKRGSDYYYEFDTLEQARAAKGLLQKKKGIAQVEEPLKVENGRESPAGSDIFGLSGLGGSLGLGDISLL